ncbi:MAG: hypothetical protein RDU20_18700 [Desulfomonilaceae bacterium]|nr:hypothetical protein [Desulfomonilaceae bacterium]
MNSWKEKLETWFAAVAFAEAGEHEMALKMTAPVGGNTVEGINMMEKLNRIFAAAAFAEADCHHIAKEILDPEKAQRGFLDIVGLKGIRVRMGRAPVPRESFAEMVGLHGVPARYGKASI